MVILRSQAEIDQIRESGRVVASVLSAVSEAAAPGVLLSELDALAAEMIAAAGAKPSFLGYHPSWAPIPYPAVLCLSVNDAVVHGIPDHYRLAEGDLLSIDCGAYIEGYHGDAAVTVAIGQVDEAAQRLSATTARALAAGIAAAVPGARIGDISHAIEAVARGAGYGLPAGLGGHGVGTAMHAEPSVPNTGRAGRGMVLREGLVIAIEPMLIESGADGCHTAHDGWTIRTDDGSRAAHFEHTIAVTAAGPQILTV
ncbi:type I methionyl aminopeptidase [Allorhizocola rhizosphaerae]|uniref:type I methionyl aminopeptidase n=1 Tax=Allorhizocola rhizosphaerae TaxID=1872709 RepID=UPI000E3D1339|nr:type I methionyl aminopeptidase [Allorhizocola rhizosphaerae]